MFDVEDNDIDENYFFPSSNKTLANIFQDVSKTTVKSEKELSDLMQLKTTQPDASVKSQCILASTFICYKWDNNTQILQGKIGFAILKSVQNSLSNHEIIIYDSNKKTLSNTSISDTLEIKVKENVYLSFYDNSKKYWTIHGDPTEISKVADTLTNLNVKIMNENSTEQSLHSNIDNVNIINFDKFIENTKITEKYDSDTDSSNTNMKTKAAILNRMASMGHSIIPQLTFKTEEKTDSSDDDNFKIKLKQPKSVIKRQGHGSDISTNPNSTQITLITSSSINQANSTTQQHLPINPPIVTDVNNLLTEQRISQSELRIHMTRLSDKVEAVLNKVNSIESNVIMPSKNVPNHVYDKLINEYENKILFYEHLLEENGITYKGITGLYDITLNKEYETDRNISEISCLKNSLEEKNKLIEKLSNELKDVNAIQKNNGFLKHILNEAFDIIIDEFEDDSTYIGVLLKQKLAKIIRKVTLETIIKK